MSASTPRATSRRRATCSTSGRTDSTITPIENAVALPSAGFRRTPWKNGGGVTLDIAERYRPGAVPGAWDGMVWRFGRTRIAVPGPFSDLSGYDRILVCVGGRGLVLRVEGGPAIDVREPFRPVRFRGEDSIESELEFGPVEVVNLIGLREAVRIDLRVLDAGHEMALPAAESVVYAPGEGARVDLAGETREIGGGDALRIVGAQPARLAAVSGRVLVAAVTPRAG